MFFITFSNLWSFFFFFIITYLILIGSVITYLLPIINVSAKYSFTKFKTLFSFINAHDVWFIFLTPYSLMFGLSLLWVGPTVSVWFGHLVFSSFQFKIFNFIILNFILIFYVFTSNSYFSSREIYDYVIVLYQFPYWLILLFFSNTIFTAIFIIEVLSTLIFLLLISSTLSTMFFYRNINLNFGHTLQQVTPHSYLQSILFFFWISLISSLNLFLFILFFYLKLLTFDWYLMEYIFLYFTTVSNAKNIMTLGFAWFILLFSIFLKCGLAPLYLWKPTFFKGIPLYTLFFYICFFYFFIFLFVIYLLTSYFSEIFFFYTFVNLTFILLGLSFLLIILFESYYIKAFMAISSILNSLFVLVALTTNHHIDFVFFL